MASIRIQKLALVCSTLLCCYGLTQVAVDSLKIDPNIIDKLLLDMNDENPFTLHDNSIVFSNVNERRFYTDGTRVYYERPKGQTARTPLLTFQISRPKNYMDKDQVPLSVTRLQHDRAFEFRSLEFDEKAEKVTAYQECWPNGEEGGSILLQCVMVDYELCLDSNKAQYWEKGYRSALFKNDRKKAEMAERLKREIPPKTIDSKSEKKFFSGAERASFYLQEYKPNFVFKSETIDLYNDVNSAALHRMKVACSSLPWSEHKVKHSASGH